jgi:hypothetical protein
MTSDAELIQKSNNRRLISTDRHDNRDAVDVSWLLGACAERPCGC